MCALGIVSVTIWTLRASLRLQQFDFDDSDYSTSTSAVSSSQSLDLLVLFSELWASTAHDEARRNETQKLVTTFIDTEKNDTAKYRTKTDDFLSSTRLGAHANVHTHEFTIKAPSKTLRTRASTNNAQTLHKNITLQSTPPSTPPMPPPFPHPHAGARDADGNWGYVADVTRLRRWMLQRYHNDHQYHHTTHNGANNNKNKEESSLPLIPPLSYLPMTVNDTATVCNAPPTKGAEGKHGWDVLLKVNVLDAPNLSGNSSITGTPRMQKPNTTITTNTTAATTFQTPPPPDGLSKGKILCGIYTYGKMHYRVTGVAETWGWRCDGFLAASTATIIDPTQTGFPAVDLPHEGPEDYNNMWQKTRSILSYMYDHYFETYDYFYLSGDDTHLIVESLRRFLYETEQAHDVATEPLFMGMKMKPPGRDFFNGGGAGYVLNRVALQRLVLDAFPKCLAKTRQSSEDRFVAICLKELEIHPMDTVDAVGQQRFNGMNTNFIGRFTGTHGYFKGVYEEWGRMYGWKTGVDLVSEQSVSFHVLRTANQMRRHHAILYQSCPANTVLAKAVQIARAEQHERTNERTRQSQS
jgi:hypothetical protein